MKSGSFMNFWFVGSRNWLMIHRSWTLDSYSVLRIFTFNDKTLLYLPVISALQFFRGSKRSRSDPNSHKPFGISQISWIVSLSKKNIRFYQMPFLFFSVACYSSNMLQHWVGGKVLIYFCKVDHSRIFINFSRNWLGLNNL